MCAHDLLSRVWLVLFHIPVLFWGLSVILNTPVYATATAMVFWCRGSNLGNRGTLIGLKRAVTHSFGSICVGAGALFVEHQLQG